jgi:hypothetical protein
MARQVIGGRITCQVFDNDGGMAPSGGQKICLNAMLRPNRSALKPVAYRVLRDAVALMFPERRAVDHESRVSALERWHGAWSFGNVVANVDLSGTLH